LHPFPAIKHVYCPIYIKRHEKKPKRCHVFHRHETYHPPKTKRKKEPKTEKKKIKKKPLKPKILKIEEAKFMETNAHGYIPRRSAIHEVLRLMVGMDDEVPRNTTCIPRWSQKSELQNTCGGGADDDDDDDASSPSGDCCTTFRGFLKR
jgi:hypothetical protein